MTTTASIAAKGTAKTGFTEELAKRCHDQLGRKVLAVVELVASSRTENQDGDEKVVMQIVTLEPAPNGMTEDHLRELARSFHYERQLAEGQAPTLEFGDNPEPDVESVLKAGAKHQPHPYLASTLSINDNALCDVCGQHEGAAVHADRSAMKDPFAVTIDDDPEGQDEPNEVQQDEDEPDGLNDPAYDADTYEPEPDDAES